MRHGFLRAVRLAAVNCLLVGSVLTGMAPAPAEPARVAVVETCAPSQSGRNTPSGEPKQHYYDPIVFPGVPGTPFNPWFSFNGPSHWHDFFGARGLNPDSMTDQSSMLEGASTCSNLLDRSAYWAPALLADVGNRFPNPDSPTVIDFRVPPRGVTVEMKGGPRTTWPPVGLSIITRKARWDCGPGTERTVAPHLCTRGTIQVRLVFPKWWDSANLHLPDEAHVSFVRVPGWTRIPKLVLRIDYGVGTTVQANRISRLSVGGASLCNPNLGGSHSCAEVYPPLHDPLSGHADVIFAWLADPR